MPVQHTFQRGCVRVSEWNVCQWSQLFSVPSRKLLCQWRIVSMPTWKIFKYNWGHSMLKLLNWVFFKLLGFTGVFQLFSRDVFKHNGCISVCWMFYWFVFFTWSQRLLNLYFKQSRILQPVSMCSWLCWRRQLFSMSVEYLLPRWLRQLLNSVSQRNVLRPRIVVLVAVCVPCECILQRDELHVQRWLLQGVELVPPSRRLAVCVVRQGVCVRE